MIQFNQYLNEEDEESPADLIIKNCQPFLKKIGYKVTKYPLYRGMDENSKVVKKTVRKNRKPLDTKIEIHNMLNDAFYKKFKIKARSECIFVAGYESFSADFGRLFYIFPIGNFKFLWSPKIKDLFNKVGGFKIYSKTKSEMETIFKKLVDKYQKTDLKKAIKSHHEIMIDCKEYYAVRKYGYKKEPFLVTLRKEIQNEKI